ncbi:hypothetical protein BJ944DRAFT_210007 [Cunninghamella echinulata]|nr:hypothetical protein BJ944DRAFT_210007 [Cunninghamella echinulata]
MARLLQVRNKKKKSAFPTASTERRTIYVNMPIPTEELDDYGQPKHHFIANKIRTAKYTWYNFLPKNLFEQFRGIANLYFLFLVILQMFPIFSTSASPVLVILPLAAILFLTGAKDAFEDNKRHKTDEGVNKAITYTLSEWSNINTPVYKVARWRRWLNTIKSWFRSLFTFSSSSHNTHLDYDFDDNLSMSLSRRPTNQSVVSATTTLRTSSTPTASAHSPIASIRQTLRSSTTSITRVFQKNQQLDGDDPQQQHNKPYRPGLVPHSVLRKKNKKKKYNQKQQAAAAAAAAAKKKKKRHEMDKRWKRTLWQDLKVGDFVFLRDDDPIPADIVILSTSEVDGLCYVETQNLDGETNLKIKRGLQATSDMSKPEHCDKASFYIESEPPHANLYSYNGVLKWKVTRRDQLASNQQQHDISHEKTEAITGSSILLRGCVLRNTDWVIGMVVFTGNETKIMLNSGKTPSKRSKMEKATNPHVSKIII